MFVKIKTILFIVFASFINLHSQSVDCPQDNNPPLWSQSQWAHYSDHVSAPATLCEVFYKFRSINDNKTEIIIDWSSYDHIDPYQNLSTDDKKDLLYFAIVQNLADASIPWVGVKQFVIIEKSQCKSAVFCYFKINQTAEIVCGNTQFWSQAEIDDLKYSYNNNTYWRSGTVLDCGFKCCERIITVEIINYNRVITGMTLNEYPGTYCEPGLSGTHCKDGNPYGCSGGCGYGWTIRE